MTTTAYPATVALLARVTDLRELTTTPPGEDRPPPGSVGPVRDTDSPLTGRRTMPIHTSAVGNLTADPEVRFTPSGAAVASFTIAINKRVRQDDGSYADGEPTFLRCSVWRDQAENVAESLTKGDSVIVVGNIEERRWQDRETGANRSSFEMTVDDIGPALRWATAKPQRVQRGQRGGQQGGYGQQGGQRQGGYTQQHGASQDPWGGQQQGRQQGGQRGGDPWGGQQPAQRPQQGQWGGPPQDEPPF